MIDESNITKYSVGFFLCLTIFVWYDIDSFISSAVNLLYSFSVYILFASLPLCIVSNGSLSLDRFMFVWAFFSVDDFGCMLLPPEINCNFNSSTAFLHAIRS